MNTFYIPTKTKKDLWYKEPWLLLVIGGPVIVIIASMFTIYLASHGSDKVLSKDYYRQGLKIDQQIQQDAKAHEYNLSGDMKLDPATGKISMQISGHVNFPDLLQLSISSNTSSSEFEDQQKVTMSQVKKGIFEGSIKTTSSSNIPLWHIVVEAKDWRLTAAWHDPYHQTLLLKPQN